MESLEEDDVIDGKREQIFGAAPEIGDAIAYGCIDDRIAIQLVRDSFPVPLEEILVDAVALIEKPPGGFEPLRETVHGCMVEAFVIHAANFQSEPDIPGFCKEEVGVDESMQIQLLIEGAGFFVVFEDAFEPKH